jgi:hypothetical protein
MAGVDVGHHGYALPRVSVQPIAPAKVPVATLTVTVAPPPHRSTGSWC